jgi:peptidoglycan/LPS O-acetylase OafA/YrhL
MGIALWLGCALMVFFAARRVPHGRPPRWAGELFAAIVSALAMGVIATTLDFGGWNELDWRAALFVLFGCAAAIGIVRLLHAGTSKGKVESI